MRSATYLLITFSLGIALALGGAPLQAEDGAEKNADEKKQTEVLGIWASAKGTIVSITRSGEELQGEVLGMRKKARLDRKNPDPELRERPVVGMQLLKDYRFKNGGWRGKLYDPGSGGTYSSYMKVSDSGKLKLRGYIGFSLLGKTQTFRPVSACTEQIIEMLRAAEIDDLC